MVKSSPTYLLNISYYENFINREGLLISINDYNLLHAINIVNFINHTQEHGRRLRGGQSPLKYEVEDRAACIPAKVQKYILNIS